MWFFTFSLKRKIIDDFHENTTHFFLLASFSRVSHVLRTHDCYETTNRMKCRVTKNSNQFESNLFSHKYYLTIITFINHHWSNFDEKYHKIYNLQLLEHFLAHFGSHFYYQDVFLFAFGPRNCDIYQHFRWLDENKYIRIEKYDWDRRNTY